jgi:hypothetical protein
MSDTTTMRYEEPGYILTAEWRLGQLWLRSKTTTGAHAWEHCAGISEVPRGIARQLPAGWRGFYATSYPVREGAREMIAALSAERDARADAADATRAATLEVACPGLARLRAALDDADRYAEEFERMMEDEGNDGARPPRPRRGDPTALAAEYPRAAAFLRMESWSYSCNMSGKSGVGKRAMARLLAGEDHVAVLADADREWGEIATRACDNS